MKNLFNNNINFRKTVFLFGLLLTGSIIAASFRSNIALNTNLLTPSPNIAEFLPDSTFDDSTEIYDLTDTAYSYSDGADSIYVIADSTNLDTTFIEGRFGNGNIPNMHNTNNYTTAKIGLGADPITCTPLFGGAQPEIINKGLYGINVSGMFDNATCPNDGSAADQWQWLSDLRPEVLRFPHGANGKFMHLLHTVGGLPTDKAVGYGYDLGELIRYFDASDNDFADLVPGIYPNITAAIAAISTQSDLNLPEWNSWMDPSVSGKFGTFLGKWQVQQQLTVTATDHSNYLTDFIKLIQKIETDNPGHKVKVIVCLNILSETSAECAAIVNFLRSNPIHNCTVPGVELGNECPTDFHWTVMGFAHFSEHAAPAGCDPAFNGSYWSFINGDPYTTAAAQTRLGLFLNPAMQLQDATGHYYNRDFIKAFKYNFLTNCKIGIPGEGTQDDEVSPLPFYLIEGGYPKTANEWNDDLVSHYPDNIPTMPPGLEKKKFDAVILHPYLDDNQNWGPPIADLLSPAAPYADRWNYDTYDTRLQAAFDDILFFDPANPSDPASDSFMGFIKHGHKVAWNDYRDVFSFIPTTPTDNVRKELWMTEYNIKTSVSADPSTLQRGVYTNGFTHGFLLQEWFLKNIKVNFASGYKKNFFTYATYQNYAGVGEDLLTPADAPRELYNYLCLDYPPYNLGGNNPNKRNYYMKRTSYLVMSMLKDITALNLKYVPTRYSTKFGNINATPTMFIDPEYNNLNMYFTNDKATEQDYYVDGVNLPGLYTPTPIITFGDAVIRHISGVQLYSNSGTGTLFNPLFNTGYTNPTPGDRTCYTGELLPPAYLYPIEIQTAYFSLNAPDCPEAPSTVGVCITVPPYSIGYVKIPIQKNYRYSESGIDDRNEIVIYPNPANTSFSFYQYHNQGGPEQRKIEIYSITGNLMMAISANENSPVDISNVPSGIYLIKIYKQEELLTVKTLIKTN